jgi:NAD+ synthase
MASAINPIGDLYKTDVFQLAGYLELPEAIIKKKPTADLWAGQSDEAELGFTYAEVDELLYELIDNRVSRERLIQQGFREEFVQKVIGKIQSSQFKRRGPVICKVSPRAITHDFHYLRDWGL